MNKNNHVGSKFCMNDGEKSSDISLTYENICINILHVVLCSRIPDSVGKDIEKACQSIYPLHDVYVRKVKMLKKPKFECKW